MTLARPLPHLREGKLPEVVPGAGAGASLHPSPITVARPARVAPTLERQPSVHAGTLATAPSLGAALAVQHQLTVRVVRRRDRGSTEDARAGVAAAHSSPALLLLPLLPREVRQQEPHQRYEEVDRQSLSLALLRPAVQVGEEPDRLLLPLLLLRDPLFDPDLLHRRLVAEECPGPGLDLDLEVDPTLLAPPPALDPLRQDRDRLLHHQQGRAAGDREMEMSLLSSLTRGAGIKA